MQKWLSEALAYIASPLTYYLEFHAFPTNYAYDHILGPFLQAVAPKMPWRKMRKAMRKAA